jgi:hypothetical protein
LDGSGIPALFAAAPVILIPPMAQSARGLLFFVPIQLSTFCCWLAFHGDVVSVPGLSVHALARLFEEGNLQKWTVKFVTNLQRFFHFNCIF